jgi:MFS family permease
MRFVYFFFQICFGVIFGPTTNIVEQWFDKHRALALGVVAMGNSLAGVTMPILFHYLLTHVGCGIWFNYDSDGSD